MKKESYERLSLMITEFDAEDVITTSGIGPGPGPSPDPGGNAPGFKPDTWEMPASSF